MKILTELLQAHNRIRENINVPLLIPDETLTKAAQYQADWMYKKQKLSHRKPPPLSWFDDRIEYYGFQGQPVSENIAWGQSSVKEVMGDWMSSAGHKRNIVRRATTHVGFGVSGPYWCTTFGESGSDRWLGFCTLAHSPSYRRLEKGTKR